MTDVIGDYSADCDREDLGLVLSAQELLSEEIETPVLESIEALLQDIRSHRPAWADRCREHARFNLTWDRCIGRLYDHLQLLKTDHCRP